jgi:hypothetical protein
MYQILSFQIQKLEYKDKEVWYMLAQQVVAIHQGQLFHVL